MVLILKCSISCIIIIVYILTNISILHPSKNILNPGNLSAVIQEGALPAHRAASLDRGAAGVAALPEPVVALLEGLRGGGGSLHCAVF